MIIQRLFRPPHEDPDPAKRVLALETLAPEADEVAALLAADPSPEVRAAAAGRCARLDAIAAAWNSESDPAVRDALASRLVPLLADAADGGTANAFLESDACTDTIRSGVARRAQEAERQRAAIAAVRDESALVELALAAERSETRMGAAERVLSAAGLQRLAEGARDKDRGVARLARTRMDAMAALASQAAEADAILARLEALATQDGPILDEVIDLDRRWAKLDVVRDAARVARREDAQRALRERFDREREAQQARSRFDRSLAELVDANEPPSTPEALASVRERLVALRDEAAHRDLAGASATLDAFEARLDAWAQALHARGDAESLVVEAERLADGTSVDDAGLPQRWQSLPLAVRTPALTRRFEAALVRIEQHRLAHIRAAEQQANAIRHELHQLLHAAEQALAAGQVHAARTVADEIKARRPDAGTLPKPTLQRLGRLMQQLSDLERWESFGQRQARESLIDRAEALAAATLDAPRLAAEVRKLRDEWKTLDQQHSGVPKAIWERFDRACEKAYAPAARHFAEMHAQKAEARKRRDEFVQAATAHAAHLLQQEPRDWRAIERWLREADRTWREGDLGSVEPKSWKGLDARFRAAVAPLRDALATVRAEAKAGRQALVDEATALAGSAMERDAPSRVKALQARWQAHSKEHPLGQRDERALWEQFRAACNAVFDARHAKRRQEDAVRKDSHRELEAICAELEQLAAAGKADSDMRRELGEIETRWRRQHDPRDPGQRGTEAHYRRAKAAVEAAISERARTREASVWQTLAAKERLCEELDAHAAAPDTATAAAGVLERWAALPSLPGAWEKRMSARRDAAARALTDGDAASAHASTIEQGRESRAKLLLELEVALGLESPPELHAERLALQVGQLRNRFKAEAETRTPRENLLEWCAASGVADARDRQRFERVLVAVARSR